MTLTLIALAVFLAALGAAAVLLWRRLPAAAVAAAGEVACVRCATPGRFLAADSFICPACRHDVRDLGVALARPGAAGEPMLRVVGFSAALCLLALVSSGIGIQALPRVDHVAGGASLWQSGKGYRAVEFAVTGQRPRGEPARGPLEGELAADLFLTNGEVITLEVQSPSLRYRVIDTAGREVVPLSADGAFNESALLRWTGAGLDPFGPDAPSLARAAYARIQALLGPGLPPPSPLPPSAEEEVFSNSGSPSYGVSSAPPAYAPPVAVIVWSLLWLAGLWLIVPRVRREPAAGSPVEGVAA